MYFIYSLQIPPTTTRILLNYFKWDKEKLYERYVINFSYTFETMHY